MTSTAEERAQTFELLATILLAIATVLTAWSAFQATKWSGVQADSYSRANASRTTGAQAATRAGQDRIVDVQVFLSWSSALAAERQANPSASTGPDGLYRADPAALSGFLYERMRDEFKPAVAAWLAQHPLTNPDAAPTPFHLPEYRLRADLEARRLTLASDGFATTARDANQTGDNYVLLTVLFAAVLFFAGLSPKLKSIRNQWVMFGFAVVLVIAGVVILLNFPVEI